MDLRLYARVLWRFKFIVVLGFVFALALAAFSVVRVSSTGVTYRESRLWASRMRLLVTQTGFPEGRLYAQTPTKPGETDLTTGNQAAKLGIPIVDPGRFNTLAIIYADLLTSDPVRQLMRRDGPIDGQVIATPMKDDQSGILLPFIDVASIAPSATGAMSLGVRSANALNSYLRDEQKANNVPVSDRVVVRTINAPKGASVFQPRSKTMPVVIFLVLMFATVGLAFLLENLRPRGPKVAERTEAGVQDAEQRRTA
jgi:hypothetical protein